MAVILGLLVNAELDGRIIHSLCNCVAGVCVCVGGLAGQKQAGGLVGFQTETKLNGV